MKVPTTLFLVAVIFPLFFLSSCSPTEEQETYRSNQWSALMENYSDLDHHLGSFVERSFSEPTITHFQTLLRTSQVSQKLIDKMTDLLQTSDVDLKHPAYHGFTHSARVGNVTASALAPTLSPNLSDQQKALFTIAALFHDVDPSRARGAPPHVSSTFVWMDSDPNAISFFNDLELETKITKAQIQTVIKYTDFDTDPQKLAAIKRDADQMAEKNFNGANVDTVKRWGPAIAYFDQVAMYIGSFEFAVQAVVGLAGEFRTVRQLQNSKDGKLDVKVTTPSDVEILRNTSNFLLPRLRDSTFQTLPLIMQTNFKNVQTSFEKHWSGRQYIN